MLRRPEITADSFATGSVWPSVSKKGTWIDLKQNDGLGSRRGCGLWAPSMRVSRFRWRVDAMPEAGVLIHRSSDYQPKNVHVPVKVAERATLGAGNSPASTVLLNVKRLAASHLFRHPIFLTLLPPFSVIPSLPSVKPM